MNSIYSVCYSAKRNLLFAGTYNDIIAVIDFESGRVKRMLEGHDGAVYGLTLDRSETRLLSSSEDGTVRIWNIETGRSEDIIHAHAEWNGTDFSHN